MKTTKRQIIPFSFYDVTGMERHLETMAANGWFLEKLGSFAWTYRRGEPKAVHYTVDYYTSASAFEPEPSEGQQTFEDFCNHAGWRCVASNAQLLVFRNDREDPVPIHTDAALQLESLERISRRMVWPWFVLLPFLCFQFWSMLGRVLYDVIGLLSSSALLNNLFLFPGLAIYTVLEICTWYGWRKKARSAAEQGDPLPPTHGHHRFLLVVLGLGVLGMVYSLLASRLPGYRALMLFLLLSYAALYLVVNGVRVGLKKKKVSTNRNRLITLTVDILLALVIIAGQSWFIFHADFNEYRLDTEMPLTIRDLRDDVDTAGYVQTYSEDATFLLREVRCFQHPPFDQPVKELLDLQYTEVDVFLPLLYQPVLSQLLHQYDDWGDHNEDYDPEKPFYEFRPVEPAPWGGPERVYQRFSYGEADSLYLLCWADKIIELEPSWFLTETQMYTAGNTLSS